MDLVGYLKVIRQRWILLVVTVAAALVGTWVTLPSQTGASTSSTTHSGTAILIANPNSSSAPNLYALALLSTVGDVPRRAAVALDFEGRPAELAAMVTAEVDPETSTLTISSTDDDAAAVTRRVNVFADALIASLERGERRRAEAQLGALQRALDDYSDQLEELDRAIERRPGSTTLKAQRSGAEARYQEVVTQIGAINDKMVTAQAPIEVLQQAVPVAEENTTFTPPVDTRGRLLVGGALGLMLGIALALVVERVDSRLRSREDVEAAFELPVLAEIPALPWHQRHSHLVESASKPGSATAEAYRALRSALLLLRPNQRSATRRSDGRGPAVILVTSARPDEGKSSTVANMAAVMAESGRRILVLSFDFRNPQLHNYLKAAQGEGLSDLLATGRPTELERVVRDTEIQGVQIVTSGGQGARPGALLAGAGPLIGKARKMADVVLIDTAPLLTVSDAVDLSPHVDAVLVVTRAGHTTAGQARASQRLLSRLGVPALGAVLIGHAPSRSYGYPTRLPLSHPMASFFGRTVAEPTNDQADQTVTATEPKGWRAG